MLRKDSFRALQLAPLLRRLDGVAAKTSISAGLAAGVVSGLALTLLAPLPVALAGFLVLLGAAAALAWSGEPVELVDLHLSPPAMPLVDLVEIPGGRFRLGSPEKEEGRFDDEGPLHPVTVSPFLLMGHPVTRRQYADLMGEDPGSPEGEANDRPANNVSWFQAVELCNRLSEREGLSPAYRITGSNDVTWDGSADGYRLPTEAEWEYACRAGTQTRWSFGEYEEQLGEYAWFETNSGHEPRPVGQKRPNPWGLHDMHGNVFEWCWDWFDSYSERPQVDPTGPPSGTGRVVRGGSFGDSPRGLRSAFRNGFVPEDRLRNIGFRCSRNPRQR